MDTLEEIHTTTRDEYGLKAGGSLQSLEKFNTLFGLRLAHTLFCAAEQVSLALQKKNISIQDTLSAVDAAMHTIIDYGRRRSSTASMMQQFKLLSNILLAARTAKV